MHSHSSFSLFPVYMTREDVRWKRGEVKMSSVNHKRKELSLNHTLSCIQSNVTHDQLVPADSQTCLCIDFHHVPRSAVYLTSTPIIHPSILFRFSKHSHTNIHVFFLLPIPLPGNLERGNIMPTCVQTHHRHLQRQQQSITRWAFPQSSVSPNPHEYFVFLEKVKTTNHKWNQLYIICIKLPNKKK